jgi:apolipoprotein N-acyltransferase
VNSPLQLLVRNNLGDNNLMGTTGDYLSLGSGPAGGGFSNAPAFTGGTEYTLVFTVARIADNSVTVTAAISGGGTNWTHSVTETNFAYRRFDSFAIRPNSLETSADLFNFSEFKVEVVAVSIAPASISLGTISRSGNNVTLNWTSTPAGSFTYTVQRKTNLLDAAWTTLQTGITGTTYTDTTASADKGFYRVSSP